MTRPDSVTCPGPTRGFGGTCSFGALRRDRTRRVEVTAAPTADVTVPTETLHPASTPREVDAASGGGRAEQSDWKR